MVILLSQITLGAFLRTRSPTGLYRPSQPPSPRSSIQHRTACSSSTETAPRIRCPRGEHLATFLSRYLTQRLQGI